MTIFKYFAKALYNNAKLSKIADFMDEIEIDKTTCKHRRNLSFHGQGCFFIDRNCFGLIVWKKQLKKKVFRTYVFFFG